jgi:hypothetical protein
MAREPGDGEETGAKRVLETGIALVHEGELIRPAFGSEAQAELAAEDAHAEIHYHFPVEIEIRAADQRIDPVDFADIVLEQLVRRLREDP